VQFSEKLLTYLRASLLRGGINLLGLPLIPKRIWPDAPSNRTAFNEFVSWVHRLQLDNVRWVVDVGANHGDFAQAASALHPKAQVLLVEPLPTLHAELSRRAEGRGGRWHLVPAALGHLPGQATLRVDPEIDGVSSLMEFNEAYLQAHPEVKPRQSFQCEVTTLDRLCADWEIELIDLLKLDVEGFEFEVLAGAGETLPRTRAVAVEVSRTRHAGEDSDPLLRMVSFLEGVGLTLMAVLPSDYAANRPWQPVEFNLLARRP
jgi:FkbM family methyltransferase